MKRFLDVLVVASSLLGGGVLLSAASCQRSTGFQQDQDLAKGPTGGEIPPSYYSDRSRSSRSATERVESMGQPKKRVVVLNFWNDTPVKANDLGLFVGDELRRGLNRTGRLILPPEARSDLTTEDLVQGDRVKVAQLIREGRKLGVAVVVIGRLTKVVFRQRGDEVGLLRQRQSLAAVDVEMKVFDVAAGREVLAAARSGEAASNAMIALDSANIESPQYRAELTRYAAREATAQLIPEVIKAVEKMAWEGRIAKIAGPKVFISAGRASGLVGGDILKVMTAGEDVYDPGSGAYLGRSQGTLKGTLEVVDFIGTDGAVAEVHTGANFVEGDTVQLY